MRPPARVIAIVALAVSVGLAAAASPFASSRPDGLERVALDRGFAEAAAAHPLENRTVAPDYVLPGVDGERLATGAAGAVGTLLVFALAAGAGRLLRRDRRPSPAAVAGDGG